MDKLFIDVDKDDGRLKLVNCHGKRFGYAYGDTKQATRDIAEYMVRTCNNSEIFIEALKTITRRLETVRKEDGLTIETFDALKVAEDTLAKLED